MVKNKTKPTSFRPRGELLEKIDSICEKLDCSRNDYINSTLESAISEDIEKENNFGSIPSIEDIPETEPRPDDPTTWRNHKTSHIIKVDFDPKDYEIDNSDKPVHEVEI